MDGWEAESWSGGGSASMSYGSSMGQGYSNSVPSSSSTPTPGSGGWTTGVSSSGYSGSGGPRPSSINVRAQLNIERMPFETSIDKIRNIFGRYGVITRVVCDYNIKDQRLHVWLDYEGEQAAETALRENGRKMERNTITVQRGSNSSDDSFSKRPRTNRSNNDSSFDDSGTNNEPISDWATSWDGSSNNNNSSMMSKDDGDRRRSGTRGGFERRGSRGDRGGRGGRGRGRYEPYGSSRGDSSKSEWGSNSNTVDWDSIKNSSDTGSSSSQSKSTTNDTSEWPSSGWD